MWKGVLLSLITSFLRKRRPTAQCHWHLEKVRTKRGKEKTLEYSHSGFSSRISSTGLGNGTMVEYLPSIHKVLGSIPSTTTFKKKKKWEKGGKGDT